MKVAIKYAKASDKWWVELVDFQLYWTAHKQIDHSDITELVNEFYIHRQTNTPLRAGTPLVLNTGVQGSPMGFISDTKGASISIE